MKDTTKRERRHFAGQQKTAIVKAHLVDGKSVADLCDQHQIQPSEGIPAPCKVENFGYDTYGISF